MRGTGRNKLETTSLIHISINRFILDIPVNMRKCIRLRDFGDTLYFTNRRWINYNDAEISLRNKHKLCAVGNTRETPTKLRSDDRFLYDVADTEARGR